MLEAWGQTVEERAAAEEQTGYYRKPLIHEEDDCGNHQHVSLFEPQTQLYIQLQLCPLPRPDP